MTTASSKSPPVNTPLLGFPNYPARSKSFISNDSDGPAHRNTNMPSSPKTPTTTFQSSEKSSFLSIESLHFHEESAKKAPHGHKHRHDTAAATNNALSKDNTTTTTNTSALAKRMQKAQILIQQRHSNHAKNPFTLPLNSDSSTTAYDNSRNGMHSQSSIPTQDNSLLNPKGDILDGGNSRALRGGYFAQNSVNGESFASEQTTSSPPQSQRRSSSKSQNSSPTHLFMNESAFDLEMEQRMDQRNGALRGETSSTTRTPPTNSSRTLQRSDPHQWFALPVRSSQSPPDSISDGDFSGVELLDDDEENSLMVPKTPYRTLNDGNDSAEWYMSRGSMESVDRQQQMRKNDERHHPLQQHHSRLSLDSSQSSIQHKQPSSQPLLHTFQQLYMIQLHCDITLAASPTSKSSRKSSPEHNNSGSLRLKCHSCILAQSKYLREKMRARRKSKNSTFTSTSPLELPGMDETTIHALLRLMYSLPVDFSQFDRRQFQKLLVSSKHYALRPLECYLSREYVSKFVDSSNVLSIIRISESKKLKFLRKFAVEYLAANFQLMKSDKKLQESIDRELLWEILHSILSANKVDETRIGGKYDGAPDDSFRYTEDAFPLDNANIALPPQRRVSPSVSSGNDEEWWMHEDICPSLIFEHHLHKLLLHCASPENAVPGRISVMCNDLIKCHVDLSLMVHHFGFFEKKCGSVDSAGTKSSGGREQRKKPLLIPLSSKIFANILKVLYASPQQTENCVVLDHFEHAEYLLCGLLMLGWKENMQVRLSSATALNHAGAFSPKKFLSLLWQHKVQPPMRNGRLSQNVLKPLLDNADSLTELLWEFMNEHATESEVGTNE